MSIDITTGAEPRDHAVHFYQHDDELVATIAEFLIEPLQSDGAVVVVATTAHLVAVEEELTRRGVEVVSARLNGSLVTVDADAALRRGLIDGWPDFGSFTTEVGDVIRELTVGGRHVKVFGEMAPLLWNSGHVGAAISLEKTWNHVGHGLPFSLLCAYPAHAVTGDGTEDAFLQICQCHSAVIGDGEDRWDPENKFVVHRVEETRSFSGESNTIGAARRFVVDTLHSWGLDQLADAASMVVSELVTNAIIHAESDFDVSLSSHGDAVRLSVRDHSPAIPVVRNPGPTAISGRGLRMVAALARQWGTEAIGDGKVVWAELCG